ncbi:hypothetical protein KI387_003736 [Taxus chinensis]|uniref:U1-type domain-containing protein n=1 Tax=Taxus chinensis TaxID=29808 RepID=A0AA38GYC9_TAXCH|nr:hypothetical protein KI387_003736 [Taxus chinensis]
MDFQQQYQKQDGGGAAYSLAGGQGFYTLESLEASQQQHPEQHVFPPGIFYAYQSSDGTIPPGSHAADLTMQKEQVKGQDHMAAYHYHQHQGHMNIPAQGTYGLAQADYGKAGALLYSEPGSYGRENSLFPRLAPGSIAPPREQYIPQEGYGPWLRDQALSSSSSSGLLQHQSTLPFAVTAASAAEWKPSLHSLPYRGLPKPMSKSQVFTSGSSGTAKRKMASQFKRIPASRATNKNSIMQPPKHREPVVTGPGGPGWCSVCEIECNSREVLESHYLGRKHKRRLEKNQELLAFQKKANERHTQQLGPGNTEDNLKRNKEKDTQTLLGNSLINTKKNQNALPDIKLQAHQQPAVTEKVKNLDKNQNQGGVAEAKASDSNLGKRKQKTKAAADNIDTKRQRLLDAGTAITELKVCTLCNAVCNSQVVFDSHLAGKKHAAQVKKSEDEANAVSQGNKLVDEANAEAQVNKIKEEANADSLGIKIKEEANADSPGNEIKEEANADSLGNGGVREHTADGELDDKDEKDE